jgi:hypothetical protein
MTDSTSRFDDIRPYSDNEVPSVIKRLAKNELLVSTVRTMKWPSCPNYLTWIADTLVRVLLKRKLSGIKTVAGFQAKIIAEFLLKWIIKNTSDGLTFSGLDKLSKDIPYIFMTNHRDIVLDPALVDYVLYLNGFSVPFITFGDNLLINDAIADLIRVNHAVIVKRGLARK